MIFNTALFSPHSPSQVDGKVIIGGGEPESLNIPAGSTIELDDKVWLRDFAEAAQADIDAGNLVVVEKVKMSAAEKTKAKKERAKKLKAELAALEAE